jgi:DNA repair protein RadA/Sms
VIIGEVGLSGELRTVGQIAMRLNEAAKIGFKRALLPRTRRKIEDVPPGIELVQVHNVAEALGVAVPKG